MQLTAGDVVGDGRFRIESILGSGTMGIAYRAADARLGRSVALKALPHSEAHEVYELKREFRRLAGLSHPNLVQLYELFAVEETCFFTMELLDGCDLVSALRGHSTPGDALERETGARVRTAFLQLAHGLKALHDAGQGHRDLKPANVFLTTQGRVVLLDFGLSSRLCELAPAGSDGAFYGSLAYAAPEQFWTAAVGEAADWYAVGAILFEVLTGRPPFRGSLEELIFLKQSRAAPRPSQVVDDVPAELDDLVVRLLDADPLRRPCAADLLLLLGPRAGAATAAAPLPAPKISGPFLGRERELALLCGWLDDVRNGAPVVVDVRGVSGIGKTELVQRFLAGLEPSTAVVLAGRCHPQESVPHKAMDPLVDELSRVLVERRGAWAVSLQPAQRDALRKLFPVLERVPELAVAALVGPAPEPQELRRRGIEALRAVLGQIAARTPLVLWIDDAQSGDLDSASLLRELLRSPGAPRVLLLMTYRAGGGGGLLTALDEPHAGAPPVRHVLDLEPLDVGQSAALVDELLGALGGGVRPDVKKQIIGEAGGSPLFVGELVRFLAEQRRGSAGGSATVGIAEVTAARVERLSSPARDLLELVAVAGGPVSRDVLLDAVGVATTGWPLLLDLCSQCLLREGSARADSVETYHDRIRDTLLATLSSAPERLRARHLQLAESMLARGQHDPQTVLQHLIGAGDRVRAAAHALLAAQQASSALAFERAAELYASALELRGDRDEDWQLRVERAQMLAAAGGSAAAARVYEQAGERAARVAEDPAAVVSLHSRAAEQYLYAGLLADGTRVLRAVLDHLGVRVPSGPRAAMRTSLQLRLRFLLRGPGVAPLDGRSVSPREMLRLDALYGAARGTVMLDHKLADALAMQHLLGALQLGEPSRALRALCMEAASEANVGGRWLRRRSWVLLEEAEELAARTGDAYDRAVILVHRGAVSLFSARFREAVTHCEEALEVFRTRCVGAAWEVTVCQSFLMAALAQLGRLNELRERAHVLLEEARRRGDRYSAAFFQNGDCVLAPLGRGDPLAALAGADAALAGLPATHFTSQHFGHLVAVVRVHLYMGDGTRAWAMIEEAWPALRASGFLALEGIGVVLHYLRACAALAAVERASVEGGVGTAAIPSLLRVARRAMRRLRRVRLATGPALALAISAALHAQRGGTARQATELADAIAAFDAVDMALHRESARLLLGLVSGCEGEVRRAHEWMRHESVADPLALARATVPGPFAVDAGHDRTGEVG